MYYSDLFIKGDISNFNYWIIIEITYKHKINYINKKLDLPMANALYLLKLTMFSGFRGTYFDNTAIKNDYILIYPVFCPENDLSNFICRLKE